VSALLPCSATNKIVRRGETIQERAYTSLVDVDVREGTITRASSACNVNPLPVRGWTSPSSCPSPSRRKKVKSTTNNKQSVADPYGNYIESGRARIRLLHRLSTDHMRYTLHTVCGRLPKWIHRASQNPRTFPQSCTSETGSGKSRFLCRLGFMLDTVKQYMDLIN